MKTTTVFVFLALAFVPSLLLSQDDPDLLKTRGWGNGRYWEKLDQDAKIQHLYGIEAGIFLYAEELSARTKSESELNRIQAQTNELSVAGFKFSDVAQQVDSFFADRANIRIPVAYAYLYSVKRMSGDTPENLERYLASLRRIWNK